VDVRRIDEARIAQALLHKPTGEDGAVARSARWRSRRICWEPRRSSSSITIILIHHTDCGMLTFTDDELAEKLEQETGVRPDWRAHSFSDVEEDVREGVERIKSSPFIPRTDRVRGFVYEVETGGLREVS